LSCHVPALNPKSPESPPFDPASSEEACFQP
jgi:hypothetical protein